MKLEELTAKLTLLDRRNVRPGVKIKRIISDSRALKRGDLFVACPGPQSDGHSFLADAFEKGIQGAIGEKPYSGSLSKTKCYLQVPNAREALGLALNHFYEFPSEKLKLIGITGTNGKTTTAFLLKFLLERHGPAAFIGTLGVFTPKRHVPLSNTTPGAEELYGILSQLVKEGIRTATVEVSSHALDQKRVHGLQFELAIFTQLSPEHLDYHPSLESYFQAKRLLFKANPRPKKMLINQDSPYGRRLLAEFPEAKSYGFTKEADYRAREIVGDFEGSEFLFEGPQGKTKFRTSLPFKHNVSNLLAVLAGLDLLGFDPARFQAPLAEIPGVPGRVERVDGNGRMIFIDYAHTPDAFEHLLSEARAFKPRRILTLFGCGGDRDPFKRPPMTRIACHYSDMVFLTSDNPRTEDPKLIIQEMRKGLPTALLLPPVLEILDRREAIEELLKISEPGDVIFILGKGHENYQIIGREKLPFDDREVVRNYFKRRKNIRVACPVEL